MFYRFNDNLFIYIFFNKVYLISVPMDFPEVQVMRFLQYGILICTYITLSDINFFASKGGSHRLDDFYLIELPES